MEKINFGNKGDANAKPLNNTNINQLQDNMENSFKSTQTISDTDTYNCNYINNAIQKHMLSASLTASITPATGQYVEVSNWIAAKTVGDKLSIQNGKIAIGPGISKIKIAGVIGTYTRNDQLIYMYLRKNGNNVTNPWIVKKTFDYDSFSYNNLIDVQENDIISIATYGASEYQLDNSKTLLVFEVVE